MAKEKWFITKLRDAIRKIGFKNLGISQTTHNLLFAIAKYADKNGYCWPLGSQLENDSGIRDDNQHRHIKILKSKNILTIKRKYDRRTRMTRNYYTLHLDAILTISMGIDGDLRVDGIAVKHGTTNEPFTKKQSCINTEPSVTMTVDPSVTMTVGSILDHSTKTHVTTGLNPLLDKIAIDITTHKAKLPKSSYLDNVQADRLDAREVIAMSFDLSFEKFWDAYPRKEKKKEAKNIWIRNNLDSISSMIIDDVMERRVRHAPWLEGRSYIPIPTSYLNGERWHDDLIGIEFGSPKKEKFNSATYLYNEVKKDYEKQGTDQTNVFNVSDHLLKKVD